MKTCRRCRESLPLDQFNRDARRADGLQGNCRGCQKILKREWAQQNKAHLAQKQREWAAANPDYQAQWREQNPEWDEQYRRDHPEVYWRSSYRYRMTTRHGHEVTEVEEFTKADVIAAYGDACFHCGGPFEELDHYPTPVSKAGPHTLDNVRPACVPCNRTTWKDD